MLCSSAKERIESAATPRWMMVSNLSAPVFLYKVAHLHFEFGKLLRLNFLNAFRREVVLVHGQSGFDRVLNEELGTILARQ
jgi:hypothetical protein